MGKNEVDSAIQRLLKLGVKVTKLWENAKITSTFAKQRISVDTSGLDAVLIETVYATDTTDYVFGYIVTPNKKSVLTQFAQASYSNIGYCSRAVELGKNILFYDSIVKNISSTSGGTANNKYQIPYRIYGIKLLGGGYSLKHIFTAFWRTCKGGVVHA